MSVSIHGTGTIIGIDQGIQISGVSTFSNNVSIGGTLTYEDVTNIDSIGIITARSGIIGDLTGNVTGDITGNIAGTSTIAGISSSISDTAVDVFIYDTSKDSDGGAWRKRTTNTSWYNETLGTATRGSRKEFPAVAVIVATSSKVIIYDGDDPDMPMWMEFISTSGQYGAIFNGRSPVSVVAKNGEISVADSVDSVVHWNFIADTIKSTASSGSWNSKRNIKGRNPSDSTNLWTNYDNGRTIVGYPLNDLAVTVLLNAPIDDTTGLPVPTIAVATDGGVSVIKDDGTVVDINRTSDDDVHHVDLDGDRVIMFMELGAIYVATIPSADQSGNPNSAWTVYGSYGGNTSGTDHPAIQAYGAGVDLVSMKDRTFATAGFNDSNDLYKGLSILSENVNSSGNGMVAWIRSDCNTGWMHGDIKGAFLSDTDTTNLVQGDILGGKGTFDDASYWTAGSSWTVSGGVATATSGSNSYLQKNGILTTGARYVIKFTVSSYSTGTLYVYCGTGAPGLQNHYLGVSANGTYTAILDAYNTNFGLYSTSFAGVVDDVTVSSVVDQDRSVNGKDLGVIGTVTRSAVATGADLVAYSGFTDDDYLSQPYNSNLDFGTGDYYMSIWAKGGGSNQCLMIREHGASDEDGAILIFQSSGKYNFYSRQNGTATWTAFSATSATYGDYWSHVVLVRTGGTLYGYVNGKLEGSTSFTGDVSNNDAEIYIGRRNPTVNNTQEYSGSLALARIGGSAPSAEQVEKMYEDEKVLFLENAKCTLYGSSDAVTALGYDEDTELLHVGTSSGRSDFQGLRRINNTTTAVTTAISASDELIAEQ